MAINIVAERKMSLEGFAEGWGKCYLKVRAVNEEQRMEWGKILNEDLADEVAIPKLREALREVLIGGRVIDTDENGKGHEVAITEDDYDSVIGALNVYWLQEAIFVSTGADRLKF